MKTEMKTEMEMEILGEELRARVQGVEDVRV